ncbi:folylpolyglutamate synthase/dihydrofolate synthase family protein [Jeotgalibacillus sp. R-1-5s-1]|uniref:bifunctional folylpolyglutamate synthase/dihydrofolate synthase n=1 Tax=Jeotgalibacillus sp. R-1-5s-1 TaxID=2555897 RepID=UPI00106C5EE3|nr:folylpolyglutamate synthase/dihydrofolate synthase family protein [Jeotgalibacillus sp. R-1-5s-1]TFD92429.1 bifunctional folylpolyglutamate synthase/dihydrofolate synthase [Jeotgalibacillus sp. R-1-5s-1]
MITSYEEAINWIHGRLRLGVKPGLSRMEWMMERLGNPERKIRAVHIGGTNGKGSTVTFLRNILQASGKTVGTFTSPYFEVFNERIAVNGAPVRDEEWVSLTQDIKRLADELEETELGGPTEFEVITAMMFHYFGNIREVDYVLVEVGLGGRLDSTNIVVPLCTCITSIGLDHTAILGDTYEEIAFEKAGIIKESVPLIYCVKHAGAKQVIKETADSKHAAAYEVGVDPVLTPLDKGGHGESFLYQDSIHLTTRMNGLHQIENAAIAIKTAEILSGADLSKEAIQKGVGHAYWPGRMETLSTRPLVIMDGAHNPEGIESLIDTVKRKYADKKVHLLFAAVSDKDTSGMIQQLDKLADEISFTTFDFPRAAKAEALCEKSTHPNKRIVTAERWISEMKSGEDHLYLLTGSLYFLSSVYHEIKKIQTSEN